MNMQSFQTLTNIFFFPFCSWNEKASGLCQCIYLQLPLAQFKVARGIRSQVSNSAEHLSKSASLAAAAPEICVWVLCSTGAKISALVSSQLLCRGDKSWTLHRQHDSKNLLNHNRGDLEMLKWEWILSFNGEDPKHSLFSRRKERLTLNVLYEGMVWIRIAIPCGRPLDLCEDVRDLLPGGVWRLQRQC